MKTREIEGAILTPIHERLGGAYFLAFGGRERQAVANQVGSHKWVVEGLGVIARDVTLDMAVSIWLRRTGLIARRRAGSKPGLTLDQIAGAFADMLGLAPELIAIERGPGRGRVSLTAEQAEEVLRRLNQVTSR